MEMRCWIVASLLVLSLPPTASAMDSAVFQCPGPSNTILYTNREQSDCHPMTLGPLTIVPTRTYSTSIDSLSYSSLQPFPSAGYDYTSPIGSMRNRLVQGYLPQHLGDGPHQPPFGFGHGPGYPYQRFTGRLGQSPQRFGHGPGHAPQNFGTGLEQHLPGFGGGAGPHPQGFGGPSERHPRSFDSGAGHPPQKLGGGAGHHTGRLR